MKKLILLIGITCLHAAASYGVLTCRQCAEAHRKDGTKSPFSCHKLKTMAKHLLLNHGTRLCCDCRQHFKDPASYRKHMLDIHKKEACPYCIFRTFEKREDYELHKDAQHIDHKYQCGICFERFPTFERFTVHTIARHKHWVCRYCPGTTDNEKDKNGEEPCVKKTEYFKEENAYWTHVREKHGNLFV